MRNMKKVLITLALTAAFLAPAAGALAGSHSKKGTSDITFNMGFGEWVASAWGLYPRAQRKGSPEKAETDSKGPSYKYRLPNPHEFNEN